MISSWWSKMNGTGFTESLGSDISTSAKTSSWKELHCHNRRIMEDQRTKKRSYQPQILRLLSIWFSTQKRSEHGHLYDSTPLSHLQLPTSTSHQDQAAHRLQRLMSPRSSSCYPAGCRNKTGKVDDWFSRKQGFLDFQLDSLQAAI